MEVLDLCEWLRSVCGNYKFGLGGVFLRDGTAASWPLHAESPDELAMRLREGGHLLPLPKESAALANVLEVSIVDFISTRISQVEGAALWRGTDRGYPDMEISGPAFGGKYHAVDIKCARRAISKKTGEALETTQSSITLYTGNTYFRHPDLYWKGVPRPFNDYASHLDIIVIYTLKPDALGRAEDLEIIVQEPWRIAGRSRSSNTREYIGAVSNIGDLRAGNGAFDTPEAFYKYWRNYPFKISKEVQKQLQKAIEDTKRELEALKAREANRT